MSRYEHGYGPIFELTKHGKRQEIHRLQFRSSYAMLSVKRHFQHLNHILQLKLQRQNQMF